MGVLTFLCFFLIPFFLKLIMTCILCVIYVREDDYYIGCIGYDDTACMD